MMKTKMIGLILLALCSQPLFSQEKAKTVPTYTVTDLGLGIFVDGISNSGIVAANNLAVDAVLYWTDGSNQIRDLSLDPRLPAVCGFKAPYSPLVVALGGISHNGKVAVTAIPNFPDGPSCIAVYDSKGAGTWTRKETLGEGSSATAVNNSGQVIGELVDNGNVFGFGPDCQFSPDIFADGINDSGQIVGESLFNDLLLCTKGVWTLLRPDFPGEPASINDSGKIVGEYLVNDGAAVHGFVYSAGKITDLGALAGSTFSEANDINRSGQVVGVAETLTGFTIFLWDGTMHDVAGLISPSDSHKGHIDFEGFDARINDKGVIAGSGVGPDGLSHLYLLTPVAPN